MRTFCGSFQGYDATGLWGYGATGEAIAKKSCGGGDEY